MALVVRAIRFLLEALSSNRPDLDGPTPGRSLSAWTLAIPVLAFGLVACGSELEGTAPRLDVDTSSPDVPDTTPDGDTDMVEPDGDTGAPDGDTVGPDGDTVGPDTDVFVPPPEWRLESLGDTGLIEDLTLVSANLGFATSGSRVLRWDGRSWVAYGEPGYSPAGTSLVHGVAADATTVVAVGDDGLVATRPVDGGVWERVDNSFTVDLWAAAIRGGRIFVAGDGGTVASLDTTAESPAWVTHFTSTTIDLRAIWADGSKTTDEGVFAVGTGGQLVFRDGTTWRATQIAANTVTLRDILGLTDGTLVAVGNAHTVTVKRPNAAAWQGQATNDDRRRDLAALALSRDGTLRAFGASGAVLRQEGTVWSIDSAAGVAAGLKDLRVAAVVPGSSAVMALASNGGGIRFDGTTWQALATGPESTVNDLAGTSGSLWVAANRGVLAHRTEAGWSAVPTASLSDLNAVVVTTRNAAEVVWAVGDSGAIIKVVDGVQSVVDAPVPLDLFGVAANATRVFACGRGGTLLEIDPETDNVVVRVSGTTADLKAMALGGDGAIWISGSFGTLLRWANTTLPPLPVLSGVGGSLNGLAPTSTGVLVVGDNGVILRATALAATLENEEPGRFLYAVATSPDARDTIALAVGSGGKILRFADDEWVAEVPAENAATFEAAWIDATGEALVGGIFRVHHLESRLLPIE
jgi:hypothetical protein